MPLPWQEAHANLGDGSSGGLARGDGGVRAAGGGPVARADGLDLTDEASLIRVLGQLEVPFDRILVTTGRWNFRAAHRKKSLAALDPAALAAQFALNATGPALVLKHCLRLFARIEHRFAVLSARGGSIGDNQLGGWHSYRAARPR